MDAYHHYYQYRCYLDKAYAHRKIYHQCMNRAAYHLRMHQILLGKDNNGTIPGRNAEAAIISTERIRNELIDVEYPNISGLNKPDIEERINVEIRNLVDQMISEQTPPESKNTSITGRYIVPLNEKGLISIRLENYAYTPPAAHGLTIVRSLTIDLNTGYVYKFSDLFKPDSNYQEVLNQIIKRQIEEREIPLISEFKGVSENQEYYLTPDSLVIYYQLYELAPYVYGIVEFPIPYSDIQEYINASGPIARLV